MVSFIQPVKGAVIMIEMRPVFNLRKQDILCISYIYCIDQIANRKGILQRLDGDYSRLYGVLLLERKGYKRWIEKRLREDGEEFVRDCFRRVDAGGTEKPLWEAIKDNLDIFCAVFKSEVAEADNRDVTQYYQYILDEIDTLRDGAKKDALRVLNILSIVVKLAHNNQMKSIKGDHHV